MIEIILMSGYGIIANIRKGLPMIIYWGTVVFH